MTKKIIIFGAGILGKKAINYFGSRNVYCFADNNKAGAFYCGKHVISFDELVKIKDDYDVVIAATVRFQLEIERQCLEAGIRNCRFFADILSLEDFESDPALSGFKNLYEGKRCFVIGNGSSLKPSDLDVLAYNSELSFGCNRIYKIFDKTIWRPDVYCSGDPWNVTNEFQNIMDIDVKTKLIIDLSYTPHGAQHGNPPSGIYKGNIYFYEGVARACIEQVLPRFSSDPSRCIFSGYTITYTMLQWAAYMGFKEIYLLGVDFTFKGSGNADFPVPHFTEDYANEADLKFKPWLPDIDKTRLMNLNAYKSAEQYSRQNGFRIYNATRGGELEVFERVDFDSLFK